MYLGVTSRANFEKLIVIFVSTLNEIAYAIFHLTFGVLSSLCAESSFEDLPELGNVWNKGGVVVRVLKSRFFPEFIPGPKLFIGTSPSECFDPQHLQESSQTFRKWTGDHHLMGN
ncbi:hypothetical protein F5879DRAFT_924700 [Lentinula edodes]|nr:hypothetical protein F5879DRAFT_924700 [Lentinula edodes]